MSEILNNIYIDRFLFVAFVKYISSQICSHVFGTALSNTFWRLWKLLFFDENIFEIILYLFIFIQKPITSITQEWLVVESCPSSHWITFSAFYRLVYSIPYHLNDLILAWRAVLQQLQKVSAQPWSAWGEEVDKTAPLVYFAL